MRPILSALLIASLHTSVHAADPDLTAMAGDYAARMTSSGIVITHDGETVSLGSYFSLWTPEYKSTNIGYGHVWGKCRPVLSGDGRTLTLEAKTPKGEARYSVTVSRDGVKTILKIKLEEDVVLGPSEYPVFMIPPEIVAGGTVEVANAAGITSGSKRVPEIPKRGGFLGHGDVLTFKTPTRKIVASTTSAAGFYPFDARVKQYRDRQGLWAFSSCSVTPGYESVFEAELKVLPPDPIREPGTVLVEPDTTVVAIATGPDPTAREKLAADELAAYLERISGKRLDRVELDRDAIPSGVVAVGRLARRVGIVTQEDLDEVRRDGYVVRVEQRRIGVCGWRDVGTVYGAYALLRHLGVKFYAPGCEVVPETQKLVIPECELRAKPFYEFRNLRRDLKLGHTPKDDMGDPREFGEPGNIVHAAAYLAPFDALCDVHPEYFAVQKDRARLHRDPEGRRFDVHLCLSSPEARRVCAARLLQWVEKQVDRTFFGVSQGDGFAWCQCDQCKAFDEVPGRVTTDRLIDYVNAVVRPVGARHPRKRILTLAYTAATSPPPRWARPARNVMVQFCPYPGRVWCQSHDLTCEKNKAGLEDIQGWIKKCPRNMYVFDYPCGYKIWYEPFGSFYAMKRKLDRYAANGVRGLFYCGVPRNFLDLFVYVQSHLHWDPHAEVDALIDGFMPAYYGAAAPQVRAYFDYLHREVERRKVHQMCEGACPGIVTAEFSEKALAMFAEAEAAVSDDRRALYRVRREKLFVLFADVNERNPVNGEVADNEAAFARRLAEFARIARTMRVRVVGRREAGIVSGWLWRIARLRVEARTWYSDPVIQRLILDPVTTFREERQRYSQKPIPGGIQIALDAFCGGVGPQSYSYRCEPREAVWIYAQDSKHPAMRAKFYLAEAPQGPARLALEAQDDDKPGAVRVLITINGKVVQAGPNPFRESGWSQAELPVPSRVLRQGENEIRIRSQEPAGKRDSKWFMVSECNVLFE